MQVYAERFKRGIKARRMKPHISRLCCWIVVTESQRPPWLAIKPRRSWRSIFVGPTQCQSNNPTMDWPRRQPSNWFTEQ